MSGNNFLDNLKKAVDSGEFNSDAAKKINEISNIANNIDKSGIDKQSLIDRRLDNAEIKTVTIEEAALYNSEFDMQMERIKNQDIANAQIATLIDIEDMVKLSISDMFDFINTLVENFGKESDKYPELFSKIEELKNKYKSIINN